MQKLKQLRTSCPLCLLLIWMTLLPACALCATLNVALVLSSDSSPYREFAAAFQRKLDDDVHIKLFPTPLEYLSGHDHADLVVPVGMQATEALIAEDRSPLLSAMVPQAAYENLLYQHAGHAKKMSAIYLSQPWGRQIDFLYAALPASERVGVLFTLKTKKELHIISNEVQRHGGRLIAQELIAGTDLSDSLETLLRDSDVLLGLPDSEIYAAGNIRNILLSTYRKNVPLFGWSKAFVSAGAIAGIFSSPEQIGRQAASVVLDFRRTGSLPNSQYPQQFNIAVNRQVSRSLRIILPSEEEIRARMMKGGYRDDD